MGFIRQQSQGSILTWTVDRTERLNALGPVIARELDQLRQSFLDIAPRPRILCLRATPIEKKRGRIWIAGGDLKELAGLTVEQAKSYSYTMTRFTSWLSQLPIPVISVLEGEAIGGGAELALAADIRLATSDSCLHFKQLAIGLATGYGGTHRLVDLVGLAHAQRLLLQSARLEAEEALALGLVHATVEPSSIESLLEAWTARLSSLAQEALSAQKRMLHNATYAHPGVRASEEVAAFHQIWRNPHHEKFLAGFTEKEL